MHETPALWNPLDNPPKGSLDLGLEIGRMPIEDLDFGEARLAVRILLERKIDTVGRLLALRGVDGIQGRYFRKKCVVDTLTRHGLRFADMDRETTVEIIAIGQKARIPARAELAGFYPLNRVVLPIPGHPVRCDSLATSVQKLGCLTMNQLHKTLNERLDFRFSRERIHPYVALASRIADFASSS